MTRRFEELDWQQTPIGEVSLRRRHDVTLDVEVYEVKLGDEYLMSSLFTAAEIALARLGLARLPAGPLDVVVGGLGLGYTAHAALQDPRVRDLVVVDYLAAVIGWHERGLLPLSAALTGDPRCRLVHGDFFALTAGDTGYDPAAPGRRFDAVLLDIDHSPEHLLHPGNGELYTVPGLRRLAAQLCPGGVFALWSNDPPDDAFTATLAAVFADARAEVVTFDNPLQRRQSANTVYVAHLP
ncbi:spermidine synthase [Dactylosporangium aurantiacum]|uniref:Spermidine synthase n=1 Tax=Dactylosporangium aurantiacum TaxID=35754 RepID=A0A9Q9MFJ4_9ACTN|nr:spermidine synthase [Dactylosporangium aurantiacum]MDG6101492.1 spermidine synthase [Dactylosporangium aurantiacum]UWZ52660.1 spermidine synthase [Dactylosporangium aurantiacum]